MNNTGAYSPQSGADVNDSSYRDRIYGRYRSRRFDAGSRSDEASVASWIRAYRYYLRDWLPENKQAKILELACGAGRFLKLLVDEGYVNIAGVDRSAEQIEVARGILPVAEHADVFDYLRSKEGAWDLIAAIDLVEHLTKDEVLDLLDLVYRALRPGGWVILQTPNAESPFVSIVRYGDFTHEVAFTPTSLSSLLRLAGFEGMESRELGPLPPRYGVRAAGRYVAWRGLRMVLRAWNLVETGNSGSGVCTRVFMMRARRPHDRASPGS